MKVPECCHVTISLLSKVLERIIHTQISDFLYSNKLLSNCQFGFRLSSSTQEAMLSMTNLWHNLLSDNKQVAAFSFDVKKAFDTEPHDQLIRVLSETGISGPLLQWISNYLTGSISSRTPFPPSPSLPTHP